MAFGVRGTAANSNLSGNDTTVTLPVGTATDDGVYVGGGNTGASSPFAGVVTSGYTSLAQLDNAGGSFNISRKIMGATPDSTVVCEGGPGTSGSAYTVTVVQELDTTTPEDATATTATGIDCPSITTVTDGALVIAAAQRSAHDDSITYPTGYSNGAQSSNLTGGCSAACASIIKATAGAENPPAFTTWDGAGGRCGTAAVRPAGGAAPTEPANVGVTFTLATCGAGR